MKQIKQEREIIRDFSFKNREVRNIPLEGIEIRSRGRHVEGYALLFGRLSLDLGGYRETIDPKALDGVIMRSDCFALLNHDINRGVLARSKNGTGTLYLKEDSKGLHYSFEAPKSALGDELLESIGRGDISGSSFAFSLKDNGDSWQRQADNSVIRTLTAIDLLFDISMAYRPAYPDTVVGTRAYEKFLTTEVIDGIKIEDIKRCKSSAGMTEAQRAFFQNHLIEVTNSYDNKK
jgi:uncharacterized protein